MKKVFLHLSFSLILGMLIISCNSKKEEVEEKPVEIAQEIEVVEDFVIDEYHINDLAITTHPTAKARKQRDSTITHESVQYKVNPQKMITDSLVKNYEVLSDVEVIAIPLDEKQTVVSYGKKNKWTGTVQVVSDLETGEVDHIIFTDKNHEDYYDVKNGMTAKEAKKLRKELKHMQHKGQVFLYEDDSNIMYLVDAKYSNGEEIVDAEIDETVITAIVWKDKNHKKHPKIEKKKK